MSFRLLLLPPGGEENALVGETWPARLREAIPDIDVRVAHSVGEAMEMIGDADAAFGDIAPELLELGVDLKWIACPQAGPRAGYYHQALVESDVVVTNTREIYNDHISAHIMAFVLAFARGLHVYVPRQLQRQWRPGYRDHALARRHGHSRGRGRHRRGDGQAVRGVRHDRAWRGPREWPSRRRASRSCTGPTRWTTFCRAVTS